MASRRKFTPEYKAEAVALVIESGRSVKDVAESLGIHENRSVPASVDTFYAQCHVA